MSDSVRPLAVLSLVIAVLAVVAAVVGRADADDVAEPPQPDRQAELDDVAHDLNQLFGNGRVVSLTTTYAYGTSIGEQRQTFHTAFVPAGKGEYTQKSTCRTTYSKNGVPTDSRVEDATTLLHVVGDQVVCSSIYKNRNGEERRFGPFQVDRLGNSIVVRNMARVLPSDFACTEFFQTREGRLGSVRRFNNGEPPNVWTEVDVAAKDADAASGP